MSFKLNSDVKLHYELPTTVEYVRSGWLSTFQSAATVSGLLAAVTAQLIVFFKAEDTFDPKDDPRREPILTLTYVALVLSIGATISSLVLTDEFADIPIRAARSPYGLESSQTEAPRINPSKPERSKTEDSKDDTTFNGSDWGLLRLFGLRRSARFTIAHWLLSLFLSSFCTSLSIVIYAIAQEQQRTKIVVSTAALFALLPIFQLLPSRATSGKPRDPHSGLPAESEWHRPNVAA